MKHIQAGCVFCDLLSKFEGRNIVSFAPLNPVTRGHRLFVPVTHVEDAGSDPLIAANVMEEAAKYAHGLGTDYNIITSCGVEATQTVFHLHIHVVPRTPNDGLQLPWRSHCPH